METKKNKTTKILTIKMPGETEQQYLAWLLYCEVGSQRKLFDTWDKLGQASGEVRADFLGALGDRPNHATIERWSKKYRWVERAELKLEEDLFGLRNETKKTASIRKHKIAEAFKRSIELKLKQLKKGEIVSTADVKAMWEMFRTELGLSTGKTEVAHTINEEDQKPPTPDEQALGKEIDQAIKNFYDRQRNTTKK
jgi:hypothetical protein